MDRVRLRYNEIQPEIPRFLDHWHDQLLKRFTYKQQSIIKERCIALGYEYRVDRMMCVMDSDKNELYYYQTDSGSYEPVVALSPMMVSQGEANNSIIVSLDCRELHPDIFKPRS